MANNYQVLISNKQVAPGAEFIVDIDRHNLYHPFTLLIKQLFPITDSPTGFSLKIFSGFGNNVPNTSQGIPIIIGGTDSADFNSGNGQSVTLNPLNGDDVDQASSTAGTFLVGGQNNACGRYIRLKFTNNDTVNPGYLTITGEI